MPRPTLAVVGCGFIFRAVYAPILETLADHVRVVALVDPNPDSVQAAAARFPGARAHADLDSLLATEKPDATMVLTPERFNTSTTLRLLEAGVPVYLEKPPAVNMEQLASLIRRESALGVPVYSAFNRRHTPLLRDWRPPAGLRKVRGLLSRKGRAADIFPYTGCHLLDTSQFFSGAAFADTSVRFETEAGPARWIVEGRLNNRAALELVFIPDHDAPAETLVFETDGGEWTIHFPNTHTAHPAGRVVFKDSAGRIARDASGDPSLDWQTAQGYRDTLIDFLDRLAAGALRDTPHRLTRALLTIDVMERMVAAPLQPA